jgi:hypothetical protein
MVIATATGVAIAMRKLLSRPKLQRIGHHVQKVVAVTGVSVKILRRR